MKLIERYIKKYKRKLRKEIQNYNILKESTKIKAENKFIFLSEDRQFMYRNFISTLRTLQEETL